ncbi:PP2C family serine/threonine-protein phosphatase [Aeribacillus sp. FSL K6-1305]|uniref:PP2C family serine/threonine-protein phosphatase n=1 Tax=Aeribacillus sp. FSL K6-1305 TaxID=2954569 RepID=UPI0030FD3FF3
MIQYQETEHIQFLTCQVGKVGSAYCGDSFFTCTDEHRFVCVVADGLGSGQAARESSEIICQTVKQYQQETVHEIFKQCHKKLKGKRGATAGILKVDFADKTITYGSVGNVRFILYLPSGEYIYPIPTAGYLPGKMKKYRIRTFSYEKGSKFIIHTDGLYASNIKTALKDHSSIHEIAKGFNKFLSDRTDDLTYIIGQLF